MPDCYIFSPKRSSRGGLAKARNRRSKLITRCMESNFPGAEIEGETLDFIRAMDREKGRRHRHIDASDPIVLAVAKSLGWRKEA